MTNKQWLKLFNEERDAAIKTQDIVQWKMFYYKWKARGIYQLELPSDEIIEISLRKMLYHIKSATDEEKETAKKWLEERGCTIDL